MSGVAGQHGLQYDVSALENNSAKIDFFFQSHLMDTFLVITSISLQLLLPVVAQTPITFSRQLLFHNSVASVYQGDTRTTKSKAVCTKLIVKCKNRKAFSSLKTFFLEGRVD